MQILLTGATGLLGSHILQEGLERGHSFKAISRHISKRSFLATEPENVEICCADLLCEEEWPDGLFDDVDCVVNAAGLINSDPDGESVMKSVNVDAARSLFARALKTGVKRWVQVSSVATLCSGQRDMVSEEDIGDFRNTAYARSKHEIDSWLDQQKTDMSLLTIHPCYMLGRWDARPSSGFILLALAKNQVPLLIDGMKNFVSPADVAEGLFQAVECQCVGHYVLGGENMAIKRFVEICAEQLSVPVTCKMVSHEVFRSLEINDRARALIEEFCLSSSVSSDRAKQDFGYHPETSIRQAVDDAAGYFVEYGMMRESV